MDFQGSYFVLTENNTGIALTLCKSYIQEEPNESGNGMKLNNTKEKFN